MEAWGIAMLVIILVAMFTLFMYLLCNLVENTYEFKEKERSFHLSMHDLKENSKMDIEKKY